MQLSQNALPRGAFPSTQLALKHLTSSQITPTPLCGMEDWVEFMCGAYSIHKRLTKSTAVDNRITGLLSQPVKQVETKWCRRTGAKGRQKAEYRSQQQNTNKELCTQ